MRLVLRGVDGGVLTGAELKISEQSPPGGFVTLEKEKNVN
jgi:hypothetical protein